MKKWRPAHLAGHFGILPGITRDTIMTLARELGYTVREESLQREALYLAMKSSCAAPRLKSPQYVLSIVCRSVKAVVAQSPKDPEILLWFVQW